MCTVLVTGARDLTDAELVRSELYALGATRVLVGDCPTGADAFALRWADDTKLPCKVFRADWPRFGRAAGPMRNAELVAAGAAEGAVCLAFPRGGRGTEDCMQRIRAAGLRLIVR